MKKRFLSRPALLLATALAFAACSNEDIQVDNPVPEPQPTAGKMKVSITGTIDDESRDTRSSFVYGESLDNSGAAGESFQWNANDKINLQFSEQGIYYIQNILSAPNKLAERQNSTTFSGEINKYTGKQTIYAISPVVPIGNPFSPTQVKVTYPISVKQNGADLSHLGATDYMWARVKDYDLGSDGENLKNAQLNFEHLGAMLRFQIKNTSDKEYTLKSVTVKESLPKTLWNEATFNFEDEKPALEKVGSSTKGKTIFVEDGKIENGKHFDTYLMVPASPAGTDLTADGYLFIVEVVVTDKKGNLLRREIKIEPKTDATFMTNGFAAGMRYYFVISVNESNLQDYYTTVNVATAGTLNTLVNTNIERLIVTGKIDQRDFAFMKSNMPNLFDLDISKATIVAYDKYEADAIPENALSNKPSLRHIALPDNLKKIGNSAFKGCNELTGSLIIPDGVETIGYDAFNLCAFFGDLAIPNSVETIGNSAFSACTGFNGKLTLPINDKFTTIATGCFSGCNFIGDLTIPNNVETIESSAFFKCSSFDGKLTLPQNVNFSRIGQSSFLDCYSLIGNLSIPNGVKTIGQDAFSGCSGLNGHLTIPNSVSEIGVSAFARCSGFIGDLTIPNSVNIIRSSAFNNCSGFDGKLTLSKNAKEISTYAFNNCSSLTSIIIPDGVNAINTSAFDGCSSLSGNLIIPKSVHSQGAQAFPDSKFTEVHLYWDTPSEIAWYELGGWNKNFMPTFIVPKNTKALYEAKSWTKIEERN